MPEYPCREGEEGVEEKIRREVERTVEGARRGIIGEKELRNIGIAIGLALVILGAVAITSTIWSSIIDVLKELWVFTANYYKFITGLLLLAIGLIVIILSSSKKSDSIQHDMHC